MSGDAVTTVYENDIANITMDDGKANAMDLDFLRALSAAFDGAAASDARAVALIGRDRFFSGGIDLKRYEGYGLEERAEHARVLARTLLQVFTFRRPVVAAVTGHAIAGGALLAFACDVRIMARGEAQLVVKEVPLGIDLPDFGIAITEAALPRHQLTELVLHGRSLSPAEAYERGLVEELVDAPAVAERARARAAQLADTVGHDAYEVTKTRMRGAAATRALETLEGDIDGFIHRVHKLAERR